MEYIRFNVNGEETEFSLGAESIPRKGEIINLTDKRDTFIVDSISWWSQTSAIDGTVLRVHIALDRIVI